MVLADLKGDDIILILQNIKSFYSKNSPAMMDRAMKTIILILVQSLLPKS